MGSLGDLKRVWASQNEFGQVTASSGESERVWASLSGLEIIRAGLGEVEQVAAAARIISLPIRRNAP